jgi:hypothetical protein
MTILDEIAPNYVRARDRWPEAPTLADHYEAVVSSYNGSSHGLVETVKSFTECVCLTILGEFGKPMPSSNPSTTELFVETLRVLGLENTRGASKFDRVLSAHNKLADALSDMRNENGPIAHGKDGFLDTLTSNHTRAFLLTGDTILCLLLSALEGKDPDLQFTREPYETFLRLHEQIDSSVTVESSVEDEEDLPVIVLTLRTPSLSEGLELRVEPSRLLYSIDRTAYIELLAASLPELLPLERVVKEPQLTVKPLPATQDVWPTAQFVPSYQGILSPLRGELQRYLDSLDLATTPSGTGSTQLVDSLLATAERNMGIDWMEREALQARMKVALRRVLIQFGIAREEAVSCAEHLVSWFRIQAVGVPDGESKGGDE